MIARVIGVTLKAPMEKAKPCPNDAFSVTCQKISAIFAAIA